MTTSLDMPIRAHLARMEIISYCSRLHWHVVEGIAERMIRAVELQRMWSVGARLGVAVSGGADSLCLLHALHELAPRWNLHLSVAHVEHGIRGAASREDAEFVRSEAASLGLPFHVHVANVPAIEGNLEQEARRVRLGFFRDLIASGAMERVATAHTRSDQAETVLYRILRGSGISGLAGILPVTREGVVRPMLTVWRAEVEAWLTDRRISWREDATNRDTTLVRNLLRHEVLPELREAFNPNLDEALARLATLAQEEANYWDDLLGPASPDGKPVVLSIDALLSEPVALARRRIRRAMEQVKRDLRQIDFAHVEAVLDLARSADGHGRIQLPGIDAFRSFEWIRIAPIGFDSARGRDYEFPVSVPGTITLLDGEGFVYFELTELLEAPDSYVRVGDEIDWSRLRSRSLELRNWRPGDQYRRVGQSHAEKIKTLFQENRIPLWERRHWPVLTCDGELVWSRRFGPAAEVAASNGPFLRIRESKPAAPPSN